MQRDGPSIYWHYKNPSTAYIVLRTRSIRSDAPDGFKTTTRDELFTAMNNFARPHAANLPSHRYKSSTIDDPAHNHQVHISQILR